MKSKNDEDFLKIVTYSTCLAFAVLAAVIFSAEMVEAGGIVLHFTYKTVLAFVLGWVLTWYLWKRFQLFLAKKENQAPSK